MQWWNQWNVGHRGHMYPTDITINKQASHVATKKAESRAIAWCSDTTMRTLHHLHISSMNIDEYRWISRSNTFYTLQSDASWFGAKKAHVAQDAMRELHVTTSRMIFVGIYLRCVSVYLCVIEVVPRNASRVLQKWMQNSAIWCLDTMHTCFHNDMFYI